VLDDPLPNITPMTEDELTADVAELTGEAPRTWKEILQHYQGQPYPIIYRAFSNLRPRLGRCDDAPWYRYTFSDTDFAVDAPQPAMSNFGPRPTGCRRRHVRTTEVTLLAQTGRNPGQMLVRCGESHPFSRGNGLLSRLALQPTKGGY
jgi:hypothetical protein